MNGIGSMDQANTPAQMPGADWRASIPRNQRGYAISGIAVLCLFAGGFGVWAATAPLSGAVIAQGVVQAQGQNQVIDHLEGGIVKSISVREGDRVARGDPILSLETIRITTDLNRNLAALMLKEAEYLRARAERDGLEKLELPDTLVQQSRTLGLAEDIGQQEAEFSYRLVRHNSQLEVLGKRITAIGDQIEGLMARRAAEEEKLELIEDDLANKEGLLAKGLTSSNEVSVLRRSRADTLGQLGSIQASIAERRTSIAELEQERESHIASRQETASARINELRSEINDLREQLGARRDMLKRTIVRAPVDGTIVKLNKNTLGAVIRPGEPVAEIVPTGSGNVIEARVEPTDADVVHTGQDARLRLVAFNIRTTPEIPAIVQYISADRLVDEATGKPYYTARLKADQAVLEKQHIGPLQTGMPVEVMILTQERTFVSYLVQPITDSFAKAFREE